jgi:hypothetical protein
LTRSDITGALMDGKGRRVSSAAEGCWSSGIAVLATFFIDFRRPQLSLADASPPRHAAALSKAKHQYVFTKL